MVADWLTSKSRPLCCGLVLGQQSISHLTSMHYPFLNRVRLSIEKLWEPAQFIKHISFSRVFRFGSVWWSLEGPRVLFGWICPCSLCHGHCLSSFSGLPRCYPGGLHSSRVFLFQCLKCRSHPCWLRWWWLPLFGVLSSSSRCRWFGLLTTASIGRSGATILYLSFSHAKHLHQSVIRDQFCPAAFDFFCLFVVSAPDCQYQRYLTRVITIEHCSQPWTSL